jgi:hypothetical protein
MLDLLEIPVPGHSLHFLFNDSWRGVYTQRPSNSHSFLEENAEVLSVNEPGWGQAVIVPHKWLLCGNTTPETCSLFCFLCCHSTRL